MITTEQLERLERIAPGVGWSRAISYSCARDVLGAYVIAQREPQYRVGWRRMARAYAKLPRPIPKVRWNVWVDVDVSPQLDGVLRHAMREYER